MEGRWASGTLWASVRGWAQTSPRNWTSSQRCWTGTHPGHSISTVLCSSGDQAPEGAVWSQDRAYSRPFPAFGTTLTKCPQSSVLIEISFREAKDAGAVFACSQSRETWLSRCADSPGGPFHRLEAPLQLRIGWAELQVLSQDPGAEG